MFRRSQRYIYDSGFTLIEILVVVAIIGILAAVVLASMGESRELANMRRAQADMRNIHTAMELLFNDTGWYPHKQETYCPPRAASGNEVNLNSPTTGLVATDGTYQDWDGPYVGSVIDPWGNPYFFDEDYYCAGGEQGCAGFSTTDVNEIWSVLVSCGEDGMTGDDSSNPQPNNGAACAYNDDNIVYVLCRHD